MSDVTPPPQRYRIAVYGGGIEELDRFAVRDRIRTGEIAELTELALVPTDDWRAAADYPELIRYFNIAAATLRTQPGFAAAAPKLRRPMETMGQRILHGLLYPVAGCEAIVLLILAILSALPFISVLATLASTVMMVDIVRTSAEGRTKMPLIDTSQGWQLVRTYLRVAFVTLVSLLPAYVFGGFALVGMLTRTMPVAIAVLGFAVTLAVAALYYPACLATIAVWDSMLESLNPMYVVRVIRTIGADYFIVVGMWFAATFGTVLLSVFSPFMSIPFIGGLLTRAVSYWLLFYVSHLLGYAVYRHSAELGWE